jgi:hypothetical protein
MCDTSQISNKCNKTSCTDVKVGNKVPYEDTYTFELYQLLISSLLSMWRVTGEMNGLNRTKVDFVVSNDKGERVVGVVAHECDNPVSQPGSVLEHIARCASVYFHITGVVQSWVLIPSLPFFLSHNFLIIFRYSISLQDSQMNHMKDEDTFGLSMIKCVWCMCGMTLHGRPQR